MLLAKIFAENQIKSVIHFAGLKAVGESVRKPADIVYEQRDRFFDLNARNEKSRRMEILFSVLLLPYMAIRKLYRLLKIVKLVKRSTTNRMAPPNLW